MDKNSFHKSRKLQSLLNDGKQAASTSARAPETIDWIDRLPSLQFAVIALACGLGTLVLITSVL